MFIGPGGHCEIEVEPCARHLMVSIDVHYRSPACCGEGDTIVWRSMMIVDACIGIGEQRTTVLYGELAVGRDAIYSQLNFLQE